MKIGRARLIFRTEPLENPAVTPDYNVKTQGVECLEWRVPIEVAGKRLDQALAVLCPRYSRSRLQDWIREGRARVNDTVVCEPKYKLWGGEHLVLAEAPDERRLAEKPEARALKIVYEDDALMVIDKPPGLVVHPGSGHWSGTLLNALLFHCPPLETLPRAGIVHRLDKETSGLMVVAKTLFAQTDLVRQLQARTVGRRYQALARGQVAQGGVVDAPIGRHPTQRTRMAVRGTGKAARTHYRVLERFSDCTLLECSLETGRTHQIRVHMMHIGHPLVGDPVYGRTASRIPAGPAFSRQALHAFRLELNHPETGKTLRWTTDPPEDMRALLETLRLSSPETRAEEEMDTEEGPEIIFARGNTRSTPLYAEYEEEDDDLE